MTPKYERRSIKDLKPATYNPRRISKSRLEDLKRNIEADPMFLEVRPIIVNAYKGREGVIIAGHMRYLACKELGWGDVPCAVVSVPIDKEREWNVKDNAHHGEWDEERLAEMIFTEMKAMQHALPSDEYDRILNTYGPESKTEEDLVEEAAKTGNPITKLGDRWELGEHVLVCGDSTKQETLDHLLGAGKKADMCFTDPPYNVAYGESAKDNMRRKERKIANDKMDAPAWVIFVDGWMQQLAERVAGAVYICMSIKEWPSVQQSFVAHGFHRSDTILWVKHCFTLGRSDYQRQYEPILVGKPEKKTVARAEAEPMLYGWHDKASHEWNGGRDQGDAWFFKRPSSNPIHPTMKPVELVAKAVANSSQRGGTVLDLFAGGGSTLIACERLSRKARCIELDPGFCDVIIGRWIGHTKEPNLKRNGKPYKWDGPIITLEGVHV